MSGRLILSLSMVLALSSAALPLRAQQASPWIHVEVIEQNEKASTVNVNLPLSVAEVALEVAPDKIVKEGKIKLPNNDISIADLRKLWNELRNAGDAQFVTVKEDDQDVSIARQHARALPAGFRFEIKDNAAFVGVIRSEGKAPVLVGDIVLEGCLAPQRIALWRLDEHNCGAQICQQKAAVASYAAGEIEHAQSSQWPNSRRRVFHSWCPVPKIRNIFQKPL